MNLRRGGLGRGLSALIPTGRPEGSGLLEVPLDAVAPNPRQPREVFDPDGLSELAASIADVGLLQPLVVRRLDGDRFELVAGERRLRAARLAGLEQVPVIVRETGDADLLREALIENIHRIDLNPLEEAAAYQQLLEDFGITQEELSRRVGKSRPAISNALRLLTLPAVVQRRLAGGVLSAGHARALLALDRREEQERLADRIVAEGLSVRATEALVQLTIDRSSGEPARPRGGRPRATASPALAALADRLTDALGARVRIVARGRGVRLTVDVPADDLDRIVGVVARGLGTHIAAGPTGDDATAPRGGDKTAPRGGDEDARRDL